MKINILLPYKEKFDKKKASSVSITVKNNLLYTQFLDKITVFGQNTQNPLFKDNFIGVKYSYLSLKSKNSYLASKMSKIISENPLEKQLIEIHNRPYLVDQLFERNNFPISLFFHNDPLTMKGSKSIKDRKNILSKCEAIFCVSKYVKNRFLENIHFNKKKVHVLYNGVDRKLEKFPNKKKEILFVGRLVNEKGAHLYANVVKRIAFLYPDWTFGLIGSYKLGEDINSNIYAKNVIDTFKKIGTQANFYGFQDNEFVQNKMKTAAIMIVPSLWEEPFGLVAAEGMSNGVCIIASKVGGIPEIIKGNGILLENINEKKLENSLSKLLSDDQAISNYQKKSWQNFELSSKLISKKLDNYRKSIFKNYYLF